MVLTEIESVRYYHFHSNRAKKNKISLCFLMKNILVYGRYFWSNETLFLKLVNVILMLNVNVNFHNVNYSRKRKIKRE